MLVRALPRYLKVVVLTSKLFGHIASNAKSGQLPLVGVSRLLVRKSTSTSTFRLR